jgi:Uma2 family endonuclease
MEQPIPQTQRYMTEEQYLAMEQLAETKHEYRDGQVFDMAGGTVEHAGIAANLIRQLGNRLDGKPCKAYGSDLRVRINKSGHYCYPDLTIVCGPVELARPGRRTTIVNPQIVIEVTSESTETDDRSDKFTDYRWIDSLQEYTLVSQQRARVETFYRQNDGIWAIGPFFTELNQILKFRTIDVEVPLSEIYDGIEFPKSEPSPPPTESD